MTGVEFFGLFNGIDPFRKLEHVQTVFGRDVMFFVKPMIDIGCFNCHRAVQERRHIGDFTPFLQPRDMVHQPLSAPDRKGRDQHRPATRKDPFQNRGEFGLGINRVMQAVAIRRFADQDIGPLKPAWWPHQRINLASQIAAEMQDRFADGQPDLGGTQQMTRRNEVRGDPIPKIDRVIKAHGLEPLQRGLRVFQCIKRLGVFVL